MRVLAITAAALSIATPGWAINKCTQKDGRVVYQDAACDVSSQGQSVRVFAGQGEPATAPRPAAEQPAPQRDPKPQPTSAPRQSGGGAASLGPRNDASDDDLVAQCLDWYRPRLKNPGGAYARIASRVGSVLTITIYATNSFGGYIPKEAACEVKNGRIDHDWTKIQAERAGWR